MVASAETGRLFDLQKILALDVRGSRGPLGTLLERSVTRILAIEPPPVSASATVTRTWRAHVRAHATALIETIQPADDADRERIAADLTSRPGQDLVWGQPGAQSG